MSRDLGDFQTPPELVKAIMKRLQPLNRQWTRVLEPTCGQGNFIVGLLEQESYVTEIQGIELQYSYVRKAIDSLPFNTWSRVTITQQNIFEIDLARNLQWESSGPLLILGNPPWITNTELGMLGSSNLPKKTNFKNLSGFDAITGSSNFDIAEYIWLKLIREFAQEDATIALLCKTSVARNVLQFAASKALPISNAAIIKIDAKKWFNAAADACLFCVELNPGEPNYEAPVFETLEAQEPETIMGFIDGQLIPDIRRAETLNLLNGTSHHTWRQGLKHDAAAVVELKVLNLSHYHNKSGEAVKVEDAYIFPFLKSSDLAGKGKVKPQRAVIVPQRQIGEDTYKLAHKAPLLWDYLNKHRETFEQRKSTIYQKQPPFAFFGLGEYSFAPYKVAISGMYKTPVFRVVATQNQRPVMLDDTCYFLPCNSSAQAVLIAALLNSPTCLDLLNSIVFWDAKRPITKKLLQRIDLHALLRQEKKSILLGRIKDELEKLKGLVSENEIEQQLKIFQEANLEDLLAEEERLRIKSGLPVLQPVLPGF
jgi:16S rRNA A1518/A1519 N6-dimethyltransferase RsmA/KsgA/DIM1 with predicted DNA glycosylase/AP lyase activity